MPPAATTLFGGRLMGCAVDIAQQNYTMSIVILQGGGLSQQQLDQVHLKADRFIVRLARLLRDYANQCRRSKIEQDR